MSDKHYFIVTCHGLSASHWLSTSLNTHPEITCPHGAGLILFNKDENKYTDDLDKRIYSDIDFGKKKSLDEHFSYLESLDTTSTYGSVHYYQLRDMPKFLRHSHNDFKLANLIRHPVSLVNSGHGLFLDQIHKSTIQYQREIYQFFRSNENLYFSIAGKYNLNLFDWDFLAFMAVCHHLYVLSSEQQFSENCMQIKMEEIVSSPTRLAQVITYLTDEKIAADEAYLDIIYDMGKVNAHTQGSSNLTEKDKFESWEPWKKEAFTHCFLNSRIRNTYEKFEYDFGFLNTT